MKAPRDRVMRTRVVPSRVMPSLATRTEPAAAGTGAFAWRIPPRHELPRPLYWFLVLALLVHVLTLLGVVGSQTLLRLLPMLLGHPAPPPAAPPPMAQIEMLMQDTPNVGAGPRARPTPKPTAPPPPQAAPPAPPMPAVPTTPDKGELPLPTPPSPTPPNPAPEKPAPPGKPPPTPAPPPQPPLKVPMPPEPAGPVAPVPPPKMVDKTPDIADAPVRLDGDDSAEGTALIHGPGIIPAGLDALKRNPPPAYPREAAIRGEAGTVGLLIHIAPDGSPREVDVIQSSGHTLLDEAAEKTVQHWHFVPAKQNGLPVDSEFRLDVDFDIAHREAP